MIFLVRIIDHYWMLIPGLKPEHLEVPWQAFSTWLGIGSLCLASFIRHFDVATYREVHSNA
jgi:hypothetical protein